MIKILKYKGVGEWSSIMKKTQKILIGGLTAFTIAATPFLAAFASGSHYFMTIGPDADWTENCIGDDRGYAVTVDQVSGSNQFRIVRVTIDGSTVPGTESNRGRTSVAFSTCADSAQSIADGLLVFWHGRPSTSNDKPAEGTITEYAPDEEIIGGDDDDEVAEPTKPANTAVF